MGEALPQAATTGEADLPYYMARNEQGTVHAATGYTRTLNPCSPTALTCCFVTDGSTA